MRVIAPHRNYSVSLDLVGWFWKAGSGVGMHEATPVTFMTPDIAHAAAYVGVVSDVIEVP